MHGAQIQQKSKSSRGVEVGAESVAMIGHVGCNCGNRLDRRAESPYAAIRTGLSWVISPSVTGSNRFRGPAGFEVTARENPNKLSVGPDRSRKKRTSFSHQAASREAHVVLTATRKTRGPR